MKKQNIVLSPAQQRAFHGLRREMEVADVVLLKALPGSGRTTILQRLQEISGGVLLGAVAREEAFLQMLEQALARHEVVIVDDLHVVTRIVSGDYPRALLFDAALTAILGDAAALRKTLVFGTAEDAPWPLARRAATWRIREFGPEDYACICRNLIGGTAGRLDFGRIHRFAPALTARQLRETCAWMQRSGSAETQVAIDYLRSRFVELEELRAISRAYSTA